MVIFGLHSLRTFLTRTATAAWLHFKKDVPPYPGRIWKKDSGKTTLNGPGSKVLRLGGGFGRRIARGKIENPVQRALLPPV